MNEDFQPPYPDPDRSGRLTRSLLFVGALGLIATPLIKSLRERWAVQKTTARSESVADKTLKDSFPPSAPPASQYFDIPANRQ